MTIKITASTLCTLCAPRFTLKACEAIEAYLDDYCGDALTIGDICVSFSEIPTDWEDEYEEDRIIAHLDNDNILISE